MDARVGIGIDFGTSNSSVALFDGEKLVAVRLELEEPAEVTPTALYLDRDLQAEIGRSAVETYLRENAGRNVELRPEELGEIVITTAGGELIQGPKQDGGAITTSVVVHALTDLDLPGRLFRGVKRWLGNNRIDRVRVFGSRYRIVALITPVLKALAEAGADAAGSARSAVYVGRPVHYEGRSEEADRVGAERMEEACRYAGLEDVTLYPEPIAAALSFLHERPDESARTVLAFDFGGGTLDLTAMRSHGTDFEILATHGVAIGGDEIDRRLYRAVVFPALGQGARVPNAFDTGLEPFAFREFEDRLLNWQLAYELNRPELRELIRLGARAGGETAEKLDRLYELVTCNQAYRVFQGIERAKVELSRATEARIQVPELDLDLPVTRERFESVIASLLEDIDACVARTLELAGVTASEIDVVVRTGGSSQIPAVCTLLERYFGDRVVAHGIFTSIAAGLALESYRRT